MLVLVWDSDRLVTECGAASSVCVCVCEQRLFVGKRNGGNFVGGGKI